MEPPFHFTAKFTPRRWTAVPCRNSIPGTCLATGITIRFSHPDKSPSRICQAVANCKMQFPRKIVVQLPQGENKTASKPSRNLTPDSVTVAALKRLGYAQRPLKRQSSGATDKAEAADNEITAKRSQHIFSLGERSDWLKAYVWELGHRSHMRKGSHHACQVSASTIIVL